MAITHKSIKAQKAIPIVKKEDNPNRLHMTQAEAIADNARLKAEREKVEAFRKSLQKDFKEDIGVPKEADPKQPEKQKDVSKLKAKMEGFRGPGSKEKKAAIQAEIDAIEGRVHENIS